MASSARKKEPIPFNADVLRWAREWRGRSIDEVAAKLKQPAQKIQEWENRESGVAPTVSQARSLADFYERSFLEFFRPSPPPVKEPDLVPDLRRRRDAKKLNPEQERELKSIQSWAEAQRETALDLYDEIGEAPPEIPEELRANVQNDAEPIDQRGRGALSFDITKQIRLRTN